MMDNNADDSLESIDIAIIGMAGRFPRAKNLAEFWHNLRHGVESISFFTDEEMKTFGVDPAALGSANFVKAAPILEGIDLFDASFFSYSPKEAATLDPQHRLFLECAWEACENAGYNFHAHEQLVGVYAGTSLSSYLLFNLMTTPAFLSPEESFHVMIGNDKDFLSTRVSYDLNLKGPSIDIQTGCSTSLVATHLACQSLLTYQCDMALAGGVSVHVPQRTGYFYQEGGVNSPDGHCRAFDARGRGTIFGSGVGVVVLKRLSDAIADRDNIHAVIKGSAINNDGSSKVGFTAPSIEGQAQVISIAHAVAGIDPETITYIEAHGTGTELGDPVEVAALIKAFNGKTREKQFCAIGSVKTNIGHLDAAAGIAGLIKTVLALKHKMLPPSLHFEEPNPKLELEGSPFYVNSKLSEWVVRDGVRRAGVSSFGIGGTNAHVILEEAPQLARSDSSRPWHLLTTSARTGSALAQATANLAEHLKQHPDVNLADVAHTLQSGRETFNYRRIFVCSSVEEAVDLAERIDPQRVFTSYQDNLNNQVVFMFPGGGAQYIGMGADIYKHEPLFRDQVDTCCELLTPHLKFDLRDLIYPAEEKALEASERLKETVCALPALFTIGYSLARLWMSWDIRPQALIGHSLGEYIAACLSGVFSLEAALALVVARARLFDRVPAGAMLSVALSEKELWPMLSADLSIAAINGPSQCVVSGGISSTEAAAAMFSERDIDFRRLHISAPGHSELVNPVLADFAEFVSTLEMGSPSIPFISNVTGTWITAEQVTDPEYWAKHLRQTVRFGDGIQELMVEPNRILLEVGPGQTLSTLARPQASKERGQAVISSMRHPLEQQSDEAYLLTALGKMWLAGAPVTLSALYRGEKRHKIELPAYPFERKRYWIEPDREAAATRRAPAGKNPDISKWFYLPSWKLTLAPNALKRGAIAEHRRKWLIFCDQMGLGSAIAERLAEEEQDVICVIARREFAMLKPGVYSINPELPGDYAALLEELRRLEKVPEKIIHLWSVTRTDQAGIEFFSQCQETGFYSLLFLSQALAGSDIRQQIHLWVAANGLQAIESGSALCPEKATILGPCKVIPQEYENIVCRCVDVAGVEGEHQRARLADQLVAEINAELPDVAIAYRGNQRWVQHYEQVPLQSIAEGTGGPREKGVYLITGGLGKVGLLLASHLASRVRAKLILTGRSAFPDRSEWELWLSTRGDEDEVSHKIRKVQEMEALGSEILIFNADAANEYEMRQVIDRVFDRFGAIHGVIHAAGLAGEKTVNLIPQIDRAECENHFRAKAYGSLTLQSILQGREIDFCLLVSSTASILGGIGAIAYSAANLFMDALALRSGRDFNGHWISVNWDGWLVGEEDKVSASYETSMDKFAMKPSESVEAFERVLTADSASQVIASTGDLDSRLDIWIRRKRPGAGNDLTSGDLGSLHPRPALGTNFVPSSNAIEQVIVEVWQEMLGIEQVSIEDNFFELGGNSLIGLKVISKLKRRLNVELPVVAIFEGPTVKALAKLIDGKEDGKPSYVGSLDRGERRREKRLQKQRASDSSLRA